MDPDFLPAAIRAAFEAEISDSQRRTGMLAGISSAYGAPERHYHNMRHLAHLAGELGRVRNEIADWNLLMLAAAYHDVVYDTARPDNEKASATRAGSELQPFLDAGRLLKLQQVVLATKHHEADADSDTNLFCDADLAILGAAPEAYDAYAAGIRSEYGLYPDAVYVPGRADVLRKLLKQPLLFKSAAFHTRYESAARSNIARELAALRH